MKTLMAEGQTDFWAISSLKIRNSREYFTWFVRVITGLEGRFRINCPSAFLKISKILREIYPKKSSGPKMWLLVNPFSPFRPLAF